MYLLLHPVPHPLADSVPQRPIRSPRPSPLESGRGDEGAGEHPGSRWRVDLHSHTSVSADGLTPPRVVAERAARAGLDRIAITDHGQIRGALEAREGPGGERVIVGEEIGCACGTELIGLFLERRILPGQPIEEVAARIRGQGGVVYAPHPFAYARDAAWHAGRALAHADVAEVFNARAFLPAWNRRAREAARARGMPAAAGSDAHFPWEIGRAWTELPPFADGAGLLRALRDAVPVGRRTGTPLAHVASLALRAAGDLLRRR
jgi:hypothetical protein